MIEEIYIPTINGQIYGRAAGDPGSPLILGLHGWSQRNGWHTWQKFLEPLSEAGYYAVSVDMPGWGKSALWGDGPLSSREAMEAVLTILEKLEKVSCILMGKSWGGGIALHFALTYPTHVSKLILTAPAYRHMEALDRLSQPVLIAWSEDDPVIPVKYAAEFEAIIPNAELTTYAFGGHSAAQKNAEDFTSRILQFLDG